MPKSQLNPAALAATVAAVGIMLVFAATGNRGYSYETSIVGLSLLFVLFGYDEESDRPMMQSLAFAAVAGLCAMAAIIFPITLMMQPKSPEQWAASLWLAATLLFFAVDRMRASSRESSAMSLASAQGVRAATYTPPAAYVPPAPVYTPPAPTYVPPASVYTPPAPTFVPQPEPAAITQPVYQAAAAAAPEPIYTPPPPPVHQPTHSVQQPVVSIAPIPQGREAIIFLNLMGEGLNVLRSVKAEHLGRDYYRIAEPKPDNERWEYEPNSVVRCRKKALSNGKQLVAFEEAPRAQ